MSLSITSDVVEMPYPEAERAAQDLLDQLGMSAIPINPIAVARALGYSVNAAVFEDPEVSGKVTVNGGQVSIDVKSSDAPTRRRFSIAHEIGHAQLHLKGVTSGVIADGSAMLRMVPGYYKRAPIEAQADAFAASLLMPTESIKKAFQQTQDLEALAHLFQVSPEAMKIRLQNLHLV